MPASLASGQDALSTNPGARTRTFRAGEGMDARVEATQGAVARCPESAEAGWPFSLVTFSLATQRESNSGAEGARKLWPFGRIVGTQSDASIACILSI